MGHDQPPIDPGIARGMTTAVPPVAYAATQPMVVIVDQDPVSNAPLIDMLTDSGIAATAVGSIQALLATIRFRHCDIVVLDMAICEDGGLSVMRSLADGQPGPGIIMLTRLATDVDRIVALEMGADDCVPKRTSPREMLARVRSLLRHRGRAARNASRAGERGVPFLPPVEAACFAGWTFDLRIRRLRAPDRDLVALTNGEFGMLTTFVTEPQTVHSRDALVRAYGRERHDPQDRSIDVNLSRLRRKLARHADDELIRTVRNGGYLFVPTVRYASADTG